MLICFGMSLRDAGPFHLVIQLSPSNLFLQMQYMYYIHLSDYPKPSDFHLILYKDCIFLKKDKRQSK
jgi:hypothetical protein